MLLSFLSVVVLALVHDLGAILTLMNAIIRAAMSLLVNINDVHIIRGGREGGRNPKLSLLCSQIH